MLDSLVYTSERRSSPRWTFCNLHAGLMSGNASVAPRVAAGRRLARRSLSDWAVRSDDSAAVGCAGDGQLEKCGAQWASLVRNHLLLNVGQDHADKLCRTPRPTKRGYEGRLHHWIQTGQWGKGGGQADHPLLHLLQGHIQLVTRTETGDRTWCNKTMNHIRPHQSLP